MSADNTLATLKLKDGFRIADIHMIWDGEEEALLHPLTKQAFAASQNYPTEEAADAAVDRILDIFDRSGRIIEYGCSVYELDLTWAEYLVAGDNVLVECPICTFPVKELKPLVADSPEQACSGCINGTGWMHAAQLDPKVG